MKTLDRPELTVLTAGESFKVLKVTGMAGATMPLHHSTKEAVVIVQEGSALLKIGGKQHVLQSGDAYVIPAGESHSLSLETDLKALVVMELDSSIEFEK